MYSDLLKEKLTKFFRSFGFRKESIFVDVCELVLRKDTFYVFVKFFDEEVSSQHIDDIENRLNGLDLEMSKHICIVIADDIEENMADKMKSCDIIHLKKNEIFVDDILRNNFYKIVA